METYDAKKTTPEVRQGSRGLWNLRVLIISMIGIVVAFGLVYLVFFLGQPPQQV